MDIDKPIKRGSAFPELTGEVFGMNSFDQLGINIHQGNSTLPDYASKTEILTIEQIQEKYGHQLTTEDQLRLNSIFPTEQIQRKLNYELYNKALADEDSGKGSEPFFLSAYLRDLPRSMKVEVFIEPDKAYPVHAVGFSGPVIARCLGRDLSPAHEDHIIERALKAMTSKEEEWKRSPERSRQPMPIPDHVLPQKLKDPNEEFVWDLMGKINGGSPNMPVLDEAGFFVNYNNTTSPPKDLFFYGTPGVNLKNDGFLSGIPVPAT